MENTISNNERKNFFKFPFIANISYTVDRCLGKTNSKLAFYNILTVGSVYTRLKHITEKDRKSGVVYKIPCSCGKSYVGQTRQPASGLATTKLQFRKSDLRSTNFLAEWANFGGNEII